jgi:S-adenosylmethionine-diacylglycerol 3-amino-3-carboxypropyl transferase
LHIHEATITDYLGSEPEGSFSKYVLLDHMDWMSRPEYETALGAEWSQIARTARRRARVIFRSGSATADFLDHVQVRADSGTRPLRALLSFNRSLAQELHSLDRVCVYRSFHIADITANGNN